MQTALIAGIFTLVNGVLAELIKAFFAYQSRIADEKGKAQQWVKERRTRDVEELLLKLDELAKAGSNLRRNVLVFSSAFAHNIDHFKQSGLYKSDKDREAMMALEVQLAAERAPAIREMVNNFRDNIEANFEHDIPRLTLWFDDAEVIRQDLFALYENTVNFRRRFSHRTWLVETAIRDYAKTLSFEKLHEFDTLLPANDKTKEDVEHFNVLLDSIKALQKALVQKLL